MGDKSITDHIQKEDAVHYATMRRRAEIQTQDFENRQATQKQEFEHRRLMLSLDRFHELEISRMRRHNAAQTKAADTGPNETNGVIKVEEGLPTRKDVGELMPGARMFQQVSENGEKFSMPLFLKVEWVDSDCGGFFKWVNKAPTRAGRDEGGISKGVLNGMMNGMANGMANGNGKVIRKGKTREPSNDFEMVS